MASGSNAYSSINKFRKKNAGTGVLTSAKGRNPKFAKSVKKPGQPYAGFDASVGF